MPDDDAYRKQVQGKVQDLVSERHEKSGAKLVIEAVVEGVKLYRSYKEEKAAEEKGKGKEEGKHRRHRKGGVIEPAQNEDSEYHVTGGAGPAVVIKLHGKTWHPNLVPDRGPMDARKHTVQNVKDLVHPIDLIIESLEGTGAHIGVTVRVPNNRIIVQVA
ncbi:hypothetical protein J4E93_005923 [Alternaria ventricosa]|uniref:uncharacterized protein n=1 Tax=Alternaria ventricosa TaxID=1187951 RepID=UPI0020C3D83F|nr:uncharacterized protein J4E93_005923 [Alternaria ventricosa]KAI4645123.1 hypothetical protein J4E93_005923 [Alternaria ventricosa]